MSMAFVLGVISASSSSTDGSLNPSSIWVLTPFTTAPTEIANAI